jgi:zinc D-Ala-D-Ala dipeptidase
MVNDGAARRAYWSRQMEDAYAFMAAVTQHPVVECGEPVVSLPAAAGAAGVAVEFSVRPHVKGLPRLYLLRAGLIEPFLAAARALLARGWVMRVEDGFRTRAMQRQLALQPYTFDRILDRVLWELDGAPLTPEFVARRVSALIAATPKIGTHMAGSAIDISVLDQATGREVDRAAPYLELSELTPMRTPFISAEAQANRAAITAVMEQAGFMAYPWEFWHYNSGDAHVSVLHGLPAPGRYGPVHVDLANGQVQPITDPTRPLNSLADIQAALEAALRRRPASL